MRHSFQTLLCLGLLALGLTSQPASAHDFQLTETLLLVRADGTYQVDLTCDLDALALGADPSADSIELAQILSALPEEELAKAEEKLVRFFERRVRVLVDGQAVRPQVSFPGHGNLRLQDPLIPSLFGITARLEGRLEEGAETIAFRGTRSLPPVHLTVLHQGTLQGRRQLLESGGESDPFPIAGETGDGANLDPRTVAGQYLVLGFWHIIPEGLDHILFVLGLFLLAARLRPLIWQVTAFTLAHAVTLTLATLGIFQLPSNVVEPLIALSIAAIAIENILTDQLKPWRPAVVFAFGLLHGLGFAGVLGELGLPEEERLTALISFNVGIELGQLAVVLLAFLVIGWWRDKPWYRKRLTIPLSLVIAAIGLWWTVERVLGG